MLGQTSPRDKHQWHRAAIPPGLLSSGGGLHTLGGLFDKSYDSLGLRDVDGMAALDLNPWKLLQHRRSSGTTAFASRCDLIACTETDLS